MKFEVRNQSEEKEEIIEFRLEKAYQGQLDLCANIKGQKVKSYILTICTDGKLCLHGNINPKIGLSLDDCGCINITDFNNIGGS